MATVSVDRVTRRFGRDTALADVSIDFPDGGFYALLGPSGSGKTTLLRLIAGFDFPDSGRILIDGEGVERVPVEHRRIGMVFQSYALFPNMSVADNVGFGLSVRGLAKAEIDREVMRALDLVQLAGLGNRRPHQLSGGQRQRVALARAIVTRPRVLLLDEPLGALDRALRADMQVELKRIQREVAITTIFVTHDQEEALTMADRIGILRDGRLVEEGPPETIYDLPATEFAATFLGSANILRGTADAGGLRLADGTAVATAPALAGRLPADGTPLAVAVRPERMAVSLAGTVPPADTVIPGTVSGRMFSGSQVRLTVSGPAGPLDVVLPNDGRSAPPVGASVAVSFDRAAAVVLTG
jgi:putative spermidine/putrescine transport system ATP-binding protein